MLIRLSRLGEEAVREATEVVGDIDQLEAAMDTGGGAVLVTGHFGNWELCGAALAVRGIPLDAVARPQANPLTDRLINDARARFGMNVIPMAGATKHSLRALLAGRAVGLVADQDARDRGLFVPFFGRPASTFRGPAVLALRTGAPVFLITAVRDGDRYTVRVRRIPVPEAVDEPERELTAAISAALEAAIRERPGQYLWQHRRWKTAAPGDGTARGNGSPPGSV